MRLAAILHLLPAWAALIDLGPGALLLAVGWRAQAGWLGQHQPEPPLPITYGVDTAKEDMTVPLSGPCRLQRCPATPWAASPSSPTSARWAPLWCPGEE